MGTYFETKGFFRIIKCSHSAFSIERVESNLSVHDFAQLYVSMQLLVQSYILLKYCANIKKTH